MPCWKYKPLKISGWGKFIEQFRIRNSFSPHPCLFVLPCGRKRLAGYWGGCFNILSFWKYLSESDLKWDAAYIHDVGNTIPQTIPRAQLARSSFYVWSWVRISERPYLLKRSSLGKAAVVKSLLRFVERFSFWDSGFCHLYLLYFCLIQPTRWGLLFSPLVSSQNWGLLRLSN